MEHTYYFEINFNIQCGVFGFGALYFIYYVLTGGINMLRIEYLKHDFYGFDQEGKEEYIWEAIYLLSSSD